MKKLVHISILGILCIWSSTLMAQCPPPDNSAGVNNFTTQTEIDNYIIDYPNCTELTVFVNIYDEEGTTDPITNLNGLANLERVDGSVKIYNTSMLTDLTGLSGLTEITRGVTIYDNTGLESIDGIENLTGIGTGTSFNTFGIYNNTVLTDISALQNVNTGLINWVSIYENTSLMSLEGMDNMNFDPAMFDFQITDNPNLSICAIESICNYISEGGNATISGNAPGCGDLNEVTTNCQIAFPNCPQGDVTLTTQAEVDQFLVDYPVCAVIPGTLTINDAGTDLIVNLNGLQNIETIYGLKVQNTTLTDFSGLNTLETISGDVEVNNISLTNITFLSSFTSIEGSVKILNNTALTDLTGLSTLEEIDGSLEIVNNDALTTLAGLDNIVANTITDLIIENNDNLSLCNMDSVCIYLANGWPATILGNDTGCATIPEVEGTCDTAECPSGDVEFLTQAELDYFILQYPNCTQISGNVTVGDLSNDISDLLPLQNITSITGSLEIENTNITNFNGLHNLQSINGDWLSIGRNNNLINMQGFDSLETVPGILIVFYNDNLETFIGMENLTTLGNLDILDNDSLLNLDGLNNVGDLINILPFNPHSIRIAANESLINIDALSNITLVNRSVAFQNNPVLEDISGLSNLTQIGDMNYFPSLRIQDNHSLTTLNLENLQAVYGKLDIYTNNALTNLDGLSSLHTVWGLTIGGNSALENIEGLSSLSTTVTPGAEVNDFEIQNNSVLTSLTGLENVTKVGDMAIQNNALLNSYEGLNNLEEIGWGLDLRGNPLVTDLSGFESLTAIGVVPHSQPVSFLIWDHASLVNIEALDNLTSFNNGDMLIAGNPQLTSLTGLDNVNPNSIAYIELLESANLSYCEVASICDFIANAPSGAVNIGNNATGCNSVAEVETACEELGIEDINLDSSITLHPNPMQETLTVSTTNGIVVQGIQLYDATGKLIISALGAQKIINVANLSSGIYFISIETNQGLYQQKLVK